MSQTFCPATAAHLRAARCIQRERPAATLPSRIANKRLSTGAPEPTRQFAASPAWLLRALLGQPV